MDSINYYPHLGRVLPNGTLCVPTSGRSEEGGFWEGETQIGPNHPCYVEWREAINDKEWYLAALQEGRRRAREERRQAANRRHQERSE